MRQEVVTQHANSLRTHSVQASELRFAVLRDLRHGTADGLSSCGGRPAPSAVLSGGEAQRPKLAPEPSNRDTCRRLYILTEPATGQHREDVRLLLGVLHRLVDQETSVDVIEHTLQAIKTSAWMVHLGPEGEVYGATVVGVGTPADRAAEAESHTGHLQEQVQ